MGSQPQYRADLADTAMPEILYTIYKHRVAGVVEARKEEVTKKVFIREGHVIWATSSDLNDSLGAFLRHTGRLTVEDFRMVMERRRQSHQLLGEILVDTGLLSPAEIYQAVREQVEAVVWSLFAWSEGEVTFEIGDIPPGGMVRIGLPMRQVILTGIERTPAAHGKQLAARLGGRDTVYEPCYQLGDLIEVAIDRDPTRLLQLVNGHRTLYEVCSSGPGSTLENAKLIYGFHVLGLIRRRKGEIAKSQTKSRSATRIKFKTGSDRIQS